jgi:endonuclease/exonuclease/phosphatase family metal-dependent hydrolase
MDTLHPCQIINVYLDPKSRAVRQSQLEFVRDNTKSGVFSYMMGDFNFVDNLDDGKMLGHQALAPAEQQVWDELRDHLTLNEISQPTHTWYRFEPNAKIVSSRIDRAYLS